MQQLIFESSPTFIFLCALLGVGYAYLLYRAKHPWSKRMNQLLFGLRAVVVALLSFFLIGPIVKLTTTIFEKPALVFLLDSSTSLKGKMDSLKTLNDLKESTGQLQKLGYEIFWKDLSGKDVDLIKFESKSSDLTGALRRVVNEWEGKNLAGIILLTDGIYNSGASPLYTPWHVPISTIGVGDTTEHADLILKTIDYNKIAYQGNQFPIRAEVVVQRLPDREVSVSILKNGARISQQRKNSEKKPALVFDFLVEAKDRGIQRFDIDLAPVSNESNRGNNRASIFVEVVEGRKKILVIAPAPHPDIKALRSTLEKNPNYEFILHIPGVSKTDPSLLQSGQTELVIFHQPFDQEMKTASLFAQLSKGKSSLLLLIGSKTNLRLLANGGIPLNFTNTIQKDEVTPVVNTSFHDFEFSENSNSIFAGYPPVSVPFGKFTFPPNSQILLNQKIGSVATDRPLLLTWYENNRKVAAFMGDGLWRWRLEEFSTTGKAEVFDQTFSKLVQYLSALDDKRKFRFFPLQTEFTDDAPIVLEGQVYNDLFEKIYGNKIEITLLDEKGKSTQFSYVLSPGSERYKIGGLKEGSYQFTASTLVNQKKESVSGRFLVTAQNIEPQNLVADFGLLRKLSYETGGNFYHSSDWNKIISNFKKAEPKELIHSEESFHPLIQVKWFFFFLFLLISAEWFLRKYSGGY